MVNKMSALKEGEGSLLDNCLMMWGSGLEDGDKHKRENLPFIIAGRGGGSIRTGQFLSQTSNVAKDCSASINAGAIIADSRWLSACQYPP